MASGRCLMCGVLACASSLIQLVVFSSIYGVAKVNVQFWRAAPTVKVAAEPAKPAAPSAAKSSAQPALRPAKPPPPARPAQKRKKPTSREVFGTVCPSAQFYGGYRNGQGGKLPDGEGGFMVCDTGGLREAAQSAAGCLVYSVGSDGEFSFERAVHKEISEKCEIHTFDAYPIEKYLDKSYNPGYPHDPVPSFVTYHAIALDENNNIDSLMQSLGHYGQTISLLKVSCNGCEVASHLGWLAGGTKIDQVVVRQARPDDDSVASFLNSSGYGCFQGGDGFHLLGCIKLPLRSSALVPLETARKKTVLRIPPPSKSSVCMVVPVYPPHFAALAARMEMVKRTNIGPPVKSVIVFGDDSEYADFCAKNADICADDDFHPMTLEELIGFEAHTKLKRMLELQHPPVRFRYKGDRRGCWSKTGGRVYQTVKKFYGVAYGPAECQTYWVCDAESLPFRKHNLAEHLALNAKTPRIVVSSWHDEPDCAKVAADDGTDQSCAIMMTNKTNGMRFKNDTAPSVWTPARWKQIFQNVDQWWYYDRTVTADWLKFMEESADMPAWSVFGFYELSDMSMYGMMMHWSAFYAHVGRTKIVNIREEIRKVDAAAFAKCCSCSAHPTPNGAPPPCSTAPELFRGCLLQIPFRRRLEIAVERLGFFGFSNYNRFTLIPDSAYNQVTDAGHGLHWCYINCFKTNAMSKILALENVDVEGINKVKDAFIHTNV